MSAAHPRGSPHEHQAVAAGDDRAFRQLFEKCARRYHDFTAAQGAVQHRSWRFENCPAESCKSARKALGMRTDPLAPAGSDGEKPGPLSASREPGEEG